MEKIKKSTNTAVKVAGVFKTLSIVGLIGCVVGAVLSFAMSGFIAQYYSDPNNLVAAQNSLDADMGIFGFIPFDSLKDSGAYGAFFGIQLLCAAVSAFVYVYLFSVLKKVMENIRDTGRSYAEADAAKVKTSFIIITVLLFLFSGLVEAVIAGILLCGLYNVTAVSGQQV
ncbi:hypothetical protein [Butyrivibrio sp. INlla16]|uniref:hypothetical protein n=1 Tax=Butyrivibrio sp. INlla16 TaxID=1520807 RepID=UPI0008906287|nr:hypothetical protein [Butyrivibrio sp. INlla16]SDB43832.1 hypothetical protein SAMN02910263_02128 [Butyrivibrio sp. INlla16]